MEDKSTSPAAEPENASHQAGTGSSVRILVVDDEEFMRRSNAGILSTHGYQVDTAIDGAVAWKVLNASKYDLLITDNHMPKVTGVELLTKLHEASIVMPVIMATGIMLTDEFTRYPWLQPVITLLKPYTVEELLKTVKEVLSATGITLEENGLLPHRDTPPATDGPPLM